MGRLASAALVLSASFVLSRVLGLLRTVVIADVFGNAAPINAYFAAFRIPDTMFTLVSGSALASAFIPVFSGLLVGRDDRRAWRMASSVLNGVCIALAGLALFSFIFAPQVMDVLAGGYPPGQRQLTIDLTRIMLLQPIFLGAVGIINSILQSYNRFVLTAVAPLIYNLVVIVGALMGHQHGVVGLAWSVVLGAVAQLLVVLPGIGSYLIHFYQPVVDRNQPATREVWRLLVPRVIGLAAFQAMLFITLFLASRLPRGSVGAINYAWLLIWFPVASLGTAAGTAIFPRLAQLSARREAQALRWTINRSLRLVLFLAIPSAVGLIVLRKPVINLLYYHGAWSPRATEQTAYAVLFYSLAIAPLAVIEVLPRVFYAMRDTATPVRIAIVAVAIDAALSIYLVHAMPRDQGQGGLALATAIATTIQAIWLAGSLGRELGGIGRRSLWLVVRDATLGSLVMGLVLFDTLALLTAVLPQRGVAELVTVVVEVSLGIGTFVAVSYALGAPELWEVRGFLRRGG
jgi:putative peptidoglycan lipid II flippase